jgi:type IV fimbrial biogenesis protein FimT
MGPVWAHRHFQSMRNARGFTLVELMVAVAVAAIGLRMASRPFATFLSRSRTSKAAAVVAGDLDLARSIAVRQRQPVRVTFTSGSVQYTLGDRSGGTIYKTVGLGTASDYKVPSVQFSPATIDFYPSGVASSALTVTLASGPSTRTVTLTRVGMIRIP